MYSIVCKEGNLLERQRQREIEHKVYGNVDACLVGLLQCRVEVGKISE
jgi:hypothetical protein